MVLPSILTTSAAGSHSDERKTWAIGGVGVSRLVPAADRIERSVAEVLREGKFLTRDISPGAPVGTKEMGDAFIRKLDEIGA